MGEVNKLSAYANKADWVWNVIQDTVKQKASNSTLKFALTSAQQDISLGRNLTKYVSRRFLVVYGVKFPMIRLDLVEVECTMELLERRETVLQAIIVLVVATSQTKFSGS